MQRGKSLLRLLKFYARHRYENFFSSIVLSYFSYLSVAHSHPKRRIFSSRNNPISLPHFSRTRCHPSRSLPFDLPFFSLVFRRWRVVENVPIIQTEALIDGDCEHLREEVCNVRSRDPGMAGRRSERTRKNGGRIG